MRAMWTGTIAFGLVSIPVNIYTATDRESGPELHYVHAGCGGRPVSEGARVSMRYRCSHCEEHLTPGQLNKGHQYGDELITLSAEEVDGLNGAKCRTAQVESFVDPDEVPVELYGALYYVAPVPPKRASRTSALAAPVTRAYQLLAETLRRTGTVAVLTISLRNREHRAILAVSEGLLTMRVLLWTEQVRERVFDGWGAHGGTWPVEEPSGAELAAATSLVEALRGKFDPAEHADPYAAKLSALLEEKAAALVAAVEPVPDNVTPLFASLTASVAG